MKRVALVVGINCYPFLSNEKGQPQDLQKAAEEANRIADLLGNYGDFEVYRFPTKEGTSQIDPRGEIGKKELGEAILQVFAPQGNVIPETALLYFAGHGWQKQVNGRSEGFLFASDSCPEEEDWGLSLQWLRKVLEVSQVRQQIVWLDCCHSGELFNFADTDLVTFFEKQQDRCFIAASREFEEAIGGVLTPALLEGLEPHNSSEGWVTNVSLAAFLEKTLKNAPQHPIIRNPGGEILLTGKQGIKGNVCPYKGLAYFDFNEEDPQYFYGRAALTQELLEKVRSRSFLAVLGMSGSGKSSVVRAGLLYQLKQGAIPGSPQCTIYTPFTPGEHPLSSFKQAVGVEIGQFEAVIKAAATERVVLAIDQFEEVFTLCREARERQLFFQGLLGAVERLQGKLCVVVVMRSDFFGKLTEKAYGGFAKAIEQNLVTVLPMSEGELKEAIVNPAEKVGVEIDRELVTQMIADVSGSPGNLPLMQYTLTQLWDEKKLNRLMLTDYTRLGGVKKALENHANRVYESLSVQEKKVAKRIFLELTRLGDGTEDTRKQVRQQDLIHSPQLREVVEKTIQKLANAKLLVTGEEEIAGKRVAVVNIAHEALIRNWGLLGQWLKDNRAALLRKQEIEDAARGWRDKGKGNDYLLQGKRLDSAEEFQKKYRSIPLSGIAQEFLDRSVQRRKRNRRFMTVGSVIGTVVVIFAGFAGINWRGAEGQRQIVFARRLANQADILREQQPELIQRSVLLAVESLKRTRSPEGEQALRNGLGLLPRPVESFEHQSEVRVISPDGQYMALVKDTTVKVVDIKNQEELFSLQYDVEIWGLGREFHGLAFSPDGKYLAIQPNKKNQLDIVDVTKQSVITTVKPKEDPTDVKFSPDNQYVAIGGFGSSVWVINTKTGREIANFDYQRRIQKVAFSPDSNSLAVILDDFVVYHPDESSKVFSVYVNEIQSGKELWSKQAHQDALTDIKFSPSGQYLATGGHDGKAIIWQAITGEEVARVDHTITVNDVTFSKNSQYFASTSIDGARILNLENNNVQTFFHFGKSPGSLKFTDDNKYLITGAGSSDGFAIYVWDMIGEHEIARIGNVSSIWSLLIHNGEYFINTTSYDTDDYEENVTKQSLTQTWQIVSDQTIVYFNHRNREARTIIFSPNGQLLFTTGMFLERSFQKYEKMKLWNPHDSTKVLEINAPQSHSVAELGDPRYGEIEVQGTFQFSSDSQYVISERHEGFRTWNVNNGEEVFLDNEELYFKEDNISPNGQYYVNQNDNGLEIFNSKTGQTLQYPIPDIQFSDVRLAFSRNSKYLVIVPPDNSKMIIWDLEQFELFKEIEITNTFPQGIRGFKFTPDENYLAISTGNIYIFDIQKETTIAHITDDTYSGTFDISPDGKYLAAFQANINTVKNFLLYPDDLLTEACNRLTRNLTREEWDQYIPNEKYRKTCKNLPSP